MDEEMVGGKGVKKGVGKCDIFNCHNFVTRSLYGSGVGLKPCGKTLCECRERTGRLALAVRRR